MIDGQFTLGVEEEYQIVHPETRELRSYVSQIIEDGKLGEHPTAQAAR